jgi:nitrate/nitrite transporter NarK
MCAAVGSFIIGGPLSGWLMEHPQFGLKDWQWLFLAEGVPSVLLGLVVLWYLPNGPKDAKWLEPSELAWLSSRLEEERAQQEKKKHFTLLQALTHPMVLLLSLIYFLNVVGGYGFDFFQPQILANAFPGYTKSQLGWLTAIPAAVTIPVMIAWGWNSDRLKENRWHVAIAAWIFVGGLVLLSVKGLSGPLVLTAMTLCVIGRWCVIGPFWGLPTAFLTGTAAAGGIAMINSIGNLGGQAGPVILGWFKDPSGSYAPGLRILAVLVFFCGVLVLVLKNPRTEATPSSGSEPPAAGK